MAFIRRNFALLVASIAASMPSQNDVMFSQVFQQAGVSAGREPKVKSKGARISVAENKRRSKKKKNIKRARRLGHYTRPGRQPW